MPRPSYRRRNYLPHPRFQLKFVAVLCGGCVLQMAIIAAVFGFFLRENFMFLVKYADIDAQITSMLYREIKLQMALILLTSLVYLVGIGLVGLFYSHRVAGPIFALKRTMKQIIEGEYVFLKFRKMDEWQEVADLFNDMIRKVHFRSEKNTAANGK